MTFTCKIGRTAFILCLMLLFIASSSVSLWAGTESVKVNKVTTPKKSAEDSGPVIKKTDEAVVPVFTVKLYQQAFIIFERFSYIISNERPRHPNTYPIFRSTFFANIFSNTIAINAP
ncbi:hypothetical protein QNI19_16850 [Cytophagaceae bacterium DM2B3-1]|uniref:Uncharacterized protein n=1 Tax=Xanthocytophaga flava TaxID=3048013 RepID=A0ABT7CNP3_9BACT|nr:hypothetical protein [Xanthocytophaga flavus]MDJ1468250.1 hypothetical protein [Xanthocytophaga flavus]MDJ1494617.1 hypothetical protein [Xanthocytophaga flavus]